MTNPYKRKLETFYTHCDCIAEWWNTISNLPFIIVGLLRLYYGTPHTILYTLYTLAGVASAYHHASPHEWTIWIDWIPIASSAVWGIYVGVLGHITIFSWFWIFTAFLIGAADHIWTPVPVPWGHVMWHLIAAVAVDSAYQDFP